MNKADTSLFHAYVVGGARASARAHIETLLAPFDALRAGNPDCLSTEYTAFTIDDARALRSWQTMTSSGGGKKFYIVYTDFINHEAQNTLLKVLEEPVVGTHIIIAVPKPETLLPTLLSRVRVLMPAGKIPEGIFPADEIKKFLSLSLADRVAFIAKIAEKGDDEDASAQVREKALAFVDGLESYLSGKVIESVSMNDRDKLETLLKLKRYLFTSGASVKTFLDTLALTF